jgi:hypothetical protein
MFYYFAIILPHDFPGSSTILVGSKFHVPMILGRPSRLTQLKASQHFPLHRAVGQLHYQVPLCTPELVEASSGASANRHTMESCETVTGV